MNKKTKYTFDPDWVMHPIYMIITQLIEYNISQKSFFEKTGLTENDLYKIVDDKIIIDKKLAKKLSDGCWYSSKMILNFQKAYTERSSRVSCIILPNKKELKWLK